MGTNNIIDIDLSAVQKTKIRIDGDDSKILEINTSDINVMSRLKEVYDKLSDFALNANDITRDENGEISDEDLTKFVNELNRIDKEMRELVDFVFQAPVSSVCVPVGSGSMYDPFNGMFRFEYIFEKLLAVYEKNFDSEFKKMSKRVQKHTGKYIKRG